MVSYAGDLRRAAQQAQARTPQDAEKIKRTADQLEKTALNTLGQTGPNIGRLLDILT